MRSPTSRQLPESYMRAALRLARECPKLPHPNPWVGCVIVRDGRVVGKGFHHGAGTNHAEVEALLDAGPRARDATLYVTLEPCCHHGRTPPCTDAILKAGIGEVYYAIKDPNPVVHGNSARLLAKHGLRVHGGLCAGEATALNEMYVKFQTTAMPFVTAKVAASLDGKIATRTGQSKWLTDQNARRRARLLRIEHQAVLVGINTVLSDDPHLGPRQRGAAEPWRIVLDSHLRIPPDSKVVRSGKCMAACTAGASAAKKARLERAGVRVLSFRGHQVPLPALLRRLAKEEVISLLVEGGGEVLGSFFDSRLVDRVCWFVSPIILGSARSRAAVAGVGVARLDQACRIQSVTVEQVGNSWLLQGKPRWRKSAGHRVNGSQ
ncbi:MAG TPA: bifunctional diaminohydroxyphosphoribosylaminopyrimidine deaminase/5-amino-6-(5-phosphoribosylamino)uracil reductase RibD [Terriglobia bacterium]|nr:bifunctional diaminohydroxyphosphoribosylaminopyrimidine deaminase/5-amino-6-(5-phosphoribosylamino)uracil reductase RibD [Terriglobia bacterium]